MKTLEILIGSLREQEWTLSETVPALLPSVLYADHVTIYTVCSDDLGEIRDFHVVYREKMGDLFTHHFLEHDVDIEYYVPGSEDLDWRSHRLSDMTRKERKVYSKLIDLYLEEFTAKLDSPNIYPIFDDPEGVLLGKPIRSLITTSQLRHSKQATLGQGLIHQLPTFPKAKVDEILDIRKDLTKLLSPFRAAVVELSEGVNENPWDNEAVADVIRDVYTGKVTPIMEEISAEAKRNKYLRVLMADAISDPAASLTSFLTFGAAQVLNLPFYASLGVASTSHLIRTFQRKRSTLQALKKNKLFIMHELNSRLGNRGF